MTHALKTWPEFYKDVESGRKNFEVRKTDRPFAEGDTILLQEWDNNTELYTGKECSFKIGYILNGPGFGIQKGFCVMALENIKSYD